MEKMRNMLEVAQNHLRKVDPIMGSVVEVVGDISLRYRPANFEAFVRIIVNQQLSDKAAGTIFNRIRKLFVNGRISPKKLLELDASQVKSTGLSNAKLTYILEIARHFIEKPNFIKQLRKMDDDRALDVLISLKGIGIWSANIFRMFHLRHADVFPYGDVSLERSILLLYGIEIDRKHRGAEDLISLWAPFRSVASIYLWEWLDQGQPNIY